MRIFEVAFLGLALGAVGCDDDKGPIAPPPPMTGRANAVTARETAAPPPTVPTASSAPRAERKFCSGQSTHSFPKGSLKTAAAAGVDLPPSTMPVGVGKWVWINLWAAWCGPCREEIPRILSWQEKLRAAGVLLDVAFVSLDDDERETHRFLDAQPTGGLRATYWLPEADRGAWLGPLGLKGTSLPVQAFVAPSGDVSCIVQGAIEDRDYAALASFLGAKK
jgi:thiol-disulfide isomerase/thioredoxin